jgi:hypothetical protein
MNGKKRFSKAAVLEALDARSARIAREQGFNRSNGTSQLGPILHKDGEAMLARAVAYGRMRAFEDFACAIEEGFAFDAAPTAGTPKEPQ